MQAFVLSGGASLGAIQVGMIQALYEREVTPDVLVGTSAGAINAAFLASRAPTVATAQELGEVWKGLRRGVIFPVNPLVSAIGLLGRRDHLVPDSGLRRVVRRHLEFDRLQDAAIPLHVMATDVLAGREVRLSDGPAVDAVVASAAIPGVFPPVERNGLWLVDGGVSDNTPISTAVALGADTIYVLTCGFSCALPQAPRGALGVLLHAMGVLTQQRLLLEIELFASRANIIVLPPPCPQSVQPVDFSHAPDLIARAHDDAGAFLDDSAGWTAACGRPAARLRPHRHA